MFRVAAQLSCTKEQEMALNKLVVAAQNSHDTVGIWRNRFAHKIGWPARYLSRQTKNLQVHRRDWPVAQSATQGLDAQY